MTKTILTALLALAAGVSAWTFAAPSADARISALPDVADEAVGTAASSGDDCPHILQRTTRQIGHSSLLWDNGGYRNVNPYSEDTWRDCNGRAVQSRRTFWAEAAQPDIANPYSGGCGGLKTIINETLNQRTTADGGTEYLWRYTERNDCGGRIRSEQWTICGPIQSVTPEILQRGMSGQDHRVVYRVRVTSSRMCNTVTQTIVNEYWTSAVPATVPAP